MAPGAQPVRWVKVAKMSKRKRARRGKAALGVKATQKVDKKANPAKEAKKAARAKKAKPRPPPPSPPPPPLTEGQVANCLDTISLNLYAAGSVLYDFCHNPEDPKAALDLRELVVAANGVDLSTVVRPLLGWLDSCAAGTPLGGPASLVHTASALAPLFKLVAGTIRLEAPAPERALHRATEVFEKQFNILSDAAETSPLLAVCAAGVLFGVADSLWRGTSVLRALTEGAHLVTGGLLMQNFIKAAALSHLFERVSDIVDEAASTVATRDPEGSAHTEWMRSGPDFYEYKMRLWEHVRWFFRPCLHRGFPLLQLLEARELPLEEHLADMASPSPAAAAAAAAAGASASSSADAAPATGGAVFTTTTVGKITFHAVVDHYQRVAGQTDSARRYAQRLGLAAARLLEERGVVAAMRQVLDSAASPGLQSALAAFQQSAASLGPEQVLGLEPVVSLARAMACAGSGCQLPSELTPAKVGALMGGLGWAAGACCFPQSLELPHSSPFGRLAARFAQAFLDVSKSLVHYGDTSSQRYLKPAWLDACSGALAAAQACCTKLTDDAAGASSCDIIKQQHGQAAVSMADVIKGSLPFLRVAMEAEANRLLLITRESEHKDFLRRVQSQLERQGELLKQVCRMRSLDPSQLP